METNKTKTISIGAGAGYSGDRIEPAVELVRSGLIDYLIFECLAERTIALAQAQKMKNPDTGFDPRLAERMLACLPYCHEKGIKIISNMGAANPLSAAKKVKQIATSLGLRDIKVAAVTGDDVLDIIQKKEYFFLEDGGSTKMLGNRIISANAYVGAKPIVEALKKKADVIITGRCADPSLFLAPVIYEFNWSMDDYNLLGKATIMGHLLECAGHLTGGYFADPGYKEVPDLDRLGFPFGVMSRDGAFELKKLDGTGGILNAATAKEQLLYEIHNPAEYLTPDVIADFTSVEIMENGKDRVRVVGGKGMPKTGKLKVSVGFREGFIAEGQISYGGPGCVARGNLAIDILKKRFKALNVPIEDIRYDIIGMNALYRKQDIEKEPNEIRIRVAAKMCSKGAAEVICNEIESLYTNGPAGGGGVTKHVSKIVAIQSVLIDETLVKTKVSFV